jgi:hypothetical protein
MKILRRGLETMANIPLSIIEGLKTETRKKPEPIDRRQFLAYALTGLGALAINASARTYNQNRRQLKIQEELGKELDAQFSYLEEEKRLEQEKINALEQNCATQQKIDRELTRYEQEQKELQSEWELYKKARESPGEIPFGQDITTDLARLIFCEGREFHYSPRKLSLFSSTVLRRAELAQVPVENVIFDATRFRNGRVIHAYSCFNSFDSNFPYAQNPLRIQNGSVAIINKKAWEACLDHAQEVLSHGSPLKNIDHYWTAPIANKPKWANGRQPVETLNSADGRKTHFYNLGAYTPAGISPLIQA